MERKVTPLFTAYILVASIMGVLFIGLKLGGLIDWSWWWVLCPLWLYPAVFTMVVAMAFSYGAMNALMDHLTKRRWK